MATPQRPLHTPHDLATEVTVRSDSSAQALKLACPSVVTVLVCIYSSPKCFSSPRSQISVLACKTVSLLERRARSHDRHHLDHLPLHNPLGDREKMPASSA